MRGQTRCLRAIDRAEQERQGEGFASQNLARQNRLDLTIGYRDGAADADDRQFPTRLGIEQRVLALARWEGETLTPWAAESGAGAGRVMGAVRGVCFRPQAQGFGIARSVRRGDPGRDQRLARVAPEYRHGLPGGRGRDDLRRLDL